MTQFRPLTPEEKKRLKDAPPAAPAQRFRPLTDEERSSFNYQTVGGIPVDTSPVQLPPDMNFSYGADMTGPRGGPPASLGQTIPRTNVTFPSYTLAQRAAAAVGVDVESELQENDLREIIGYSPNKDFTIDFLQKSLSERYGLPEQEVVRWGPDSGAIEFFNPKNRRFTPVNSKNFTVGDLKQFYGPATTGGTAFGMAVVGALGGPYAWITSPTFGAAGAWLGEMMRLQKGKEFGVHNLDDEAMIKHANTVAKVDFAAGLGGEAVMGLHRVWKMIKSPTGMSAGNAQQMLDYLRMNSDLVDELNAILRSGGRDERFVLPARQDIKEQSIGGLDDVYKQEVKEAAEAVEAAARVATGAPPTGKVMPDPSVGTPAHQAMLEESRRIQNVADESLEFAERQAFLILDQYGAARLAAEGRRILNVVNVHSRVLGHQEDRAWNIYRDAIGQPNPGTRAFNPTTEFTSNIQVPISQHLIDTYSSKQIVAARSLLSRKATGSKPLKKPKKGGTIDLAVLQNDIEELRHLQRSQHPDFRGRALTRDLDALVKLRNDFLAQNHPAELRLLEAAEAASTTYHNFIGRSTLARILKPDDFGNFTLNDVTALRRIWNDKTGSAMRELVAAARHYFGGRAALQNSALLFYKANVIPKGGTIMSRKLHDQFVDANKEILEALFPDPSMYQFGRLAQNVERAASRAKSVQEWLRHSSLGKIAGGTSPEKLGKAVFAEKVSDQNVRTVMIRLERYGPEAVQSMQDAVGREVFNMMTPGGTFSIAAMHNVVTKYGNKLNHIYGPQFVRNLELFERGMKTTVGERVVAEPEKTTLFGMFMRFLANPPLTQRGRGQSFVEAARQKAAKRAVHRALRDPELLEQIVRAGDLNFRNARVVDIMSQVGAVTMLTDHDLTPEWGPLALPLVDQAGTPPHIRPK